MISNAVILLTACVNPNGMNNTFLQDSDLRILQYNKALQFYLTQTSYKIVVVENTLHDFSDNYLAQITSGRLECLTFDGNDYDKTLGKGYGEALIVKYAFEHSKMINAADNIIKITGRLIILNITKLISNVEIMWDKNYLFVACDTLLNQSHAFSQFIVASKSFFSDYFIPNASRISDRENCYFEHILAESIINWKNNGNKHYLFFIPIEIYGISGTTGATHIKPSLVRKVRIFLKSLYLNYINKHLK